MSVIRILPEAVSNRIAAGEVIERPASIVKELVENALDANATRIVVSVERGGRSLVRVVDNGCGMDSEDALLCLEAHATSKIRDPEDIENIHTLGFRGEALPSIASVTRFTLQSRTQDAIEGTEVIVEGGVISQVQSTGCAPGTAITARNLFYNMPARRKFLRTIATEESHIQEMVLTQALAHPDVAFELNFDDRQVLAVRPGGNIRTRAAMLLGRDLVRSMLNVSHQQDGIRVTGLVARPGVTRSGRKEQRTFVNGRAIEADTIYYAIRDAYHTMVMKGRFPPVLLFLQMDPQAIDINVHPAKREVRFREMRKVGDAVGEAVRRALRGLITGEEFDPGPTRQSTSPPPQTPLRQANLPDLTRQALTGSMTGAASPSVGAASEPTQPPPEPPPTPPSPDQPAQPIPPAKADEHAPPPPPPPPEPITTGEPAESTDHQQELANLQVLGQLADQYLLAEGANGLVLIDQRAAHERILFEQLLAQSRDGESHRQGLLMPVTIDLGPADAEVLKQNLPHFQELGFDVEPFGNNTFIINAVPPHFPQENVRRLVRQILDDLEQSPSGRKRLDQRWIAASATQAAVQARRLEVKEVSQLLQRLARTELPYVCPRGRPTMINLSYQELEKRFGRR